MAWASEDVIKESLFYGRLIVGAIDFLIKQKIAFEFIRRK
jgi:hypothetical protein